MQIVKKIVKTSLLILLFSIIFIISANAADPPSVPTIIAHADYHTSASTTVTWYRYSTQSIQSNYRVGTSSGTGDVLNGWNNDTCYTPTCTLESSGFTMTPINSYYWSVRDCNELGGCSEWATEDAFVFTNSAPTVPTMTSHSNYHSSGTTTVSWSVSSDPDGDGFTYNVRVGTSDGASNVLSQSGTSSTTSSSFAISPTNTYYYASQACDVYSACSAWATSGSFTFSNSAPSVPSINAHADYHTSASTTSSWSASSDSDGDSITYYYNVGTSSGGTNVYNNVATASTSTSSYTMTPQNSYYWKVKACDTWACSSYSTEDVFVFTNSAPTVPSLVLHSNYHNSSSTSVVWSASSDSDSDGITYYYKIGTSSGGTQVFNDNTTGNLYSTSFTMTPANDYYWTVKACDTWTCSAYATQSSFLFTNSVPTVPSLITHSDFHNLSNTTVNWTVSTDSDGDTITYDAKVYNTTTGILVINQTNISTNYSQTFNTANQTNYNFTARANDSYGYSAWATVKTFDFINSIPIVQDVTVSPSTASNTTNLSVSLNATDSHGDYLTKHYLWYKNGVLNSSWNDTITLLYSGNYTVGDIIYVKGYVNDSFNDSAQTQSNSVIIRYSNTAPTLSGISLNPTTKKYNKTIWVNTTSNITDIESSLVQFQTYYYNGADKVYLGNSSWVTPSNFTNVSITISWSDGLTHTIYGQAKDNGDTNQTVGTNLTSNEVTAIFTSDITAPNLVTSLLSTTSITVGDNIIITAQFNGQGANVSSALVRVERPDATTANWSMTCESGEIVTCTYLYTATSDVGTYYVRYFYPIDDSGNTGTNAGSLSFSASVVVVSSGGGGGGGGSTVTIIEKETENATAVIPLLTLRNITTTQPELEEISKCFTESLFLANKCSGFNYGVVVQPASWFLVFSGAFLMAGVVVVGRGLYQDKPRDWVTEPLLYGTTTVLAVVVFVSSGINLYLFNLLFNSPLYAYSFFSVALWGGIVSLVWDEYYYGKKT